MGGWGWGAGWLRKGAGGVGGWVGAPRGGGHSGKLELFAPAQLAA